MNVQELDLNLLRVFDAVLHEKRRDGGGGAPRTDPARGVQRPCAPARRVRATRCSCARPAAWMPPRSPASSPRRSGRRLPTGVGAGARARLRPGELDARVPLLHVGRRPDRVPAAAGRARAARRGGGAAGGGGLDVEDIAGALAAGALDLAVGFLPGLGPPVMRQPLFRDPTSASCAPTIRRQAARSRARSFSRLRTCSCPTAAAIA